MLKEPQ